MDTLLWRSLALPPKEVQRFATPRVGVASTFALGHSAMGTILLVLLILLLIGAVPAWPYNAGWGYYPSGGIGLVLLIVVILVVLGRI
jgi:hypothetical protein